MTVGELRSDVLLPMLQSSAEAKGGEEKGEAAAGDAAAGEPATAEPPTPPAADAAVSAAVSGEPGSGGAGGEGGAEQTAEIAPPDAKHVALAKPMVWQLGELTEMPKLRWGKRGFGCASNTLGGEVLRLKDGDILLFKDSRAPEREQEEKGAKVAFDNAFEIFSPEQQAQRAAERAAAAAAEAPAEEEEAPAAAVGAEKAGTSSTANGTAAEVCACVCICLSVRSCVGRMSSRVALPVLAYT